MDPSQLLDFVIRPTLIKMRAHSKAAEILILGTIWQESRGKYIMQLNNGPAVGLIQMEPSTHDDIWENYLKYRKSLADRVSQFLSVSATLRISDAPPYEELFSNIAYAVAMCRVHYMRVKEPLPHEDDIASLAAYWKRHYNTNQGKGRESEFIKNFPDFHVNDA